MDIKKKITDNELAVESADFYAAAHVRGFALMIATDDEDRKWLIHAAELFLNGETLKPREEIGTLKLIQQVIQTCVAGNPLVTVEEIPKWLFGFLTAAKAFDDERLGEIKRLTKELREAREKLGVEVIEAEGLPVATMGYSEFDEEIAEAARDYERVKKGAPENNPPR